MKCTYHAPVHLYTFSNVTELIGMVMCMAHMYSCTLSNMAHPTGMVVCMAHIYTCIFSRVTWLSGMLITWHTHIHCTVCTFSSATWLSGTIPGMTHMYICTFSSGTTVIKRDNGHMAHMHVCTFKVWHTGMVMHIAYTLYLQHCYTVTHHNNGHDTHIYISVPSAVQHDYLAR